jgi:hypothetical protein
MEERKGVARRLEGAVRRQAAQVAAPRLEILHSRILAAPFGVFPADTQEFPSGCHFERRQIMGIGVSLLLIAVGAILVWAVDVAVSGVELVTVGWILMAVGLAGALLSLIFWSSWGGFGGPADGRRRTVVREDY